METIRPAVKALIVRGGRLLLNHCRNAGGEYFALPGGGQQVGERLDEALVRECREEIGVTVAVGALCFVRDHIVANHEYSYVTESPHQLEMLFRCTLRPGEEPRLGPSPDAEQLGIAWLDAREMQERTIKPSWLVDVMRVDGVGTLSVYQGDRD
jgi:ADP-ribose pyrophosphatase YjhB (NUDIX family)